MPIDRAVPATVLYAASTDSQFRSGILSLAMSSTCFFVTVPTLFLFGSFDPFARFAARLSRIDAGGVLVMNVYGPVGVDRDDDGDDQPFVLRGLRVEVLAEVHDVQAVGTERGPDRRRGGRLPRGNLELHHCRNFLRHLSSLSRQLPAPAPARA